VRNNVWGNVWRVAAGAAVLTALGYWLFCSETGVHLRHTDMTELAAYIQSFGLFAVLAGAFVIIAQTWFPIVPFVVIAGTNVLVFGFWTGFALNYGMSVLAAILVFRFARTFGRDWVVRKTAGNDTIRRFNESAEKQGFWYILTARLIPVLPSQVINIGSAVSGVPFRQFTLATIIGKFPIVFLESLIGYDLLFIRQHKEQLIVLVLIFAVVIGIAAAIRKKTARMSRNG